MSFPYPPSDLLMQIANDPDPENFTRSFPNVRSSVVHYLKLAGLKFEDFSTILDLGCGVGRFLWAFSDHLQIGQELHGCDLNGPCVQWCQSNISFATIKQNHPGEDLPYPDSSLDFVYALSVFSHLSLRYQFKYAAEMVRVLKPGGVLLFTTHGLGFMQVFSKSAHLFPIKEYYVFGMEGLLTIFSTEKSITVEGQREIAAAYNLEASREIFNPLDVLYHEPISQFAAGQSITIMRKQPGSKVLAIDKSAIDFNDGKVTVKIAPQPGVVLLAYFTAARTLHGVGREAFSYDLCDSVSGRVIASGSIAIGTDTIFADTHFIPIRVSLPPVASPAFVRLMNPAGFDGDFQIADVRILTSAP